MHRNEKKKYLQPVTYMLRQVIPEMNITTFLFALALFNVMAFPQIPVNQIEGKVVFENADVIFCQIDDHAWIGTGHMMASIQIQHI